MPVQLANQRKQEDKPLAGKIALVTGASKGIGRAIALELASQGAGLAILSRSAQALFDTKALLASSGHVVFAKTCDVSNAGDLESFVEEVSKALGSIHILINNAGIYATESVSELSVETWRSVVETNLTAALRASRSVLKNMIDSQWGRIINISSLSGKKGEVFGSAYSASKFGLIGLTQSLALEVAKFGVTVNAVCPGWVETDMSTTQLTDPNWCKLNGIEPCNSIEIAKLSVPQMRFIEAQEVADLVAYLCSDKAKGITGQAINICGGLSLV